MWAELVKLSLVFGLVGFVWQLFSSVTSVGSYEKGILFALGFMFAAGALHLFVLYSPSMGVGSFVRWTFPIIAGGLFCASLGNAGCAAVACILFAAAHAALEAMMRIRVIGIARKKGSPGASFVLACGFAAISVGATIGETLYNILLPYITPGDGMVTIAIFTVLVLVSALIPETTRPGFIMAQDTVSSKTPSDSERRATAIAKAHSLSSREYDVLVLMLDGRSGPVIREALGLSKSTVDTHVRHIYQKVGVTCRQELIDLSRSEE